MRITNTQLLLLFLVAAFGIIIVVVLWSLHCATRTRDRRHARITDGQQAAFCAGRLVRDADADADVKVAKQTPTRTLWVVSTVCINAGSNANVRRAQYQRAFRELKSALCEEALVLTFARRVLLVVDNGGARATYLDDLAAEMCAPGLCCKIVYTDNERDVVTDNKGVRELADLSHALAFAQGIGMRDDEWLVKITGRYVIQTPNPVLNSLLDDENNNKIDVVMRQGSYLDVDKPMEERSAYDAVTGLFAMRSHVWQSLFRAYPTVVRGVPGEATDRVESDPIEWWVARHIQRTVAHERIRVLDRLNCLISPGSDTLYLI